MKDNTDARIHTAGDDPNGRAERRRRQAFIDGWTAAKAAYESARFVGYPPEEAIESWQAATRDEGVDGVHPRKAR